jgi:hypothetical protein
MLTALTSLAMIALAIHTKRIHAHAMEAMRSEARTQAGPESVAGGDRQRRDAS